MVAILMLLVGAFAYSGQVDGDFTLHANTSTAILAGVDISGRAYYVIVNESADYVIRHATWNLDQADIWKAFSSSGPCGLPVNVNHGSWEDKYNITQSSWWVIIQSTAAPANVAPYSARFTWRQRQK